MRSALFYPKADLPVPDAALRASAVGDLDAPLVARVCTDILGEPVGVEEMPGGTLHRLWRVGCAGGPALVFRASTLDDGLAIDAAVEPLLRREGLPALRVLAVDRSRTRCPADFAIIEEARGTPLSAFDDDEAKLLPLLNQLGRLLARVHRITLDGYGLVDVIDGKAKGTHASWDAYVWTNLEAHVNRCLEWGAITEAEAKRIVWTFDGCRGIFEDSRASLLHGDPGSANVFAEGGTIAALIDWEDTVAGDPVYEIAFWATFHPERRHAAFLDGYRAEGTLPPDFEPRFWLYFLRVALAKTVVRHRLGLKDLPGREPASRRIQLGLSRLRLGGTLQ